MQPQSAQSKPGLVLALQRERRSLSLVLALQRDERSRRSLNRVLALQGESAGSKGNLDLVHIYMAMASTCLNLVRSTAVREITTGAVSA